MPAELDLKVSFPGELTVSLPGFNRRLSSRRLADGLRVTIPSSLCAELAGQPAVVIRISDQERPQPALDKTDRPVSRPSAFPAGSAHNMTP